MVSSCRYSLTLRCSNYLLFLLPLSIFLLRSTIRTERVQLREPDDLFLDNNSDDARWLRGYVGNRASINWKTMVCRVREILPPEPISSWNSEHIGTSSYPSPISFFLFLLSSFQRGLFPRVVNLKSHSRKTFLQYFDVESRLEFIIPTFQRHCRNFLSYCWLNYLGKCLARLVSFVFFD